MLRSSTVGLLAATVLVLWCPRRAEACDFPECTDPVQVAPSREQRIPANAPGLALIVPANTGPFPSTKRVSGGMWIAGRTKRIPPARARIAPTLMNADR